MAVRRIYLFVLVALLAAVLPLASIDFADAQEVGERLSFSGRSEGDLLVRPATSAPTVPEVSPGWPNADEIGEEIPTHRFSSDDSEGGEGRERARLVTPNDAGVVDGEELSVRVPFGGERAPVELVADGDGGLRSTPGSAFDVEIPGSAGDAASRADQAPPAAPAPEEPSETIEDPGPSDGVDSGDPAAGGGGDPVDDTGAVDDVDGSGSTTDAADDGDAADGGDATDDGDGDGTDGGAPGPEFVEPPAAPVDDADGLDVEPGSGDVLSRSVAAVTVGGERLVLGVGGGVAAPGRSARGGTGVRFDDVAASGADVEVTVSDVGVKTTWELASVGEFDAGLVETLEIPAGWSATQVGSAVEIRDETGELVVLWAGGPVWDAQIAADYGFAADGDLNPYTLAAVAALDGVTDEAEVERVLADAVPVSDLVAYATVELVDVVDGVVTVRHVVDRDWVADPGRVWPVSVDPTLAPNPSNGYTTNEFFPNSSYYWATNDGFTVGQGWGQYEKQSYVDFDLSTIEDSGALIDSASLELYQDYADTCSGRLLEVSRLTEAFDSSVSWNDPSAITTDGQVSQNSNKGRFFCSDGWIYVDVTDIVQAWADGDTNYGFRLDGDYTSTSSTKIFEDSPAPVLDIDYTALSVDATYSPGSSPVGNYPEAGSDVSSPVLGDPQGGVLPVAVTNDGNRDWFELGVCLGYRLYDTSTGNPVAGTDGISDCPGSGATVGPGETWTKNNAEFVVPDSVADGLYDLKWDMAEPDGSGGWTFFSALGVSPSSAVRIRVGDAPEPSVSGGESVFFTGQVPTLQVGSSHGDAVRWSLKKVSGFGSAWGGCDDATTMATTTALEWTPASGDVAAIGWYRFCVSVEDTALDAGGVWSAWEPGWFRIIDTAIVAADPARLGNDPNSQFQGGVNASTGSFTTTRRDVAIPTVNGEMVFERFFNSGSDTDGVFGPGWSHSYSARLIGDPYDETVTLVLPDGRVVDYDKSSGGEGPWRQWPYFSENGEDPAVTLVMWEDVLSNNFERWELTYPSGDVWEFDEEGKWTQIDNPRDHHVDLAYNGSDQLISVTDEESGRQIRFNYDTGRIETIEVDHPDGVSSPLKWGYAYEDGYLKSACDPRGPVDPIVPGSSYCEHYLRSFTRIDEIVNAAGDTTHSFTLDVDGKVSTLTEHFATADTTDVDPTPATAAYVFDYSGSSTEVTDPNGGVWKYNFDSLGRVTKIRSPEQDASTATDITYGTGSEVGVVVRVEDAATRTDYLFESDFDLKQRLSSEAGGGGTEEQGWWNWYDDDHNLTWSCDPRSPLITTNLFGTTPATTTYCTRQWFNSESQITRREHPAPDWASRPSEYWTYTTGSGGVPSGLVATYTDLTGVVVDYTYDTDGNLTEEENTSTGVRRVYTYDDWGRELTVTEYADDYPSGIVVSTTTYTVNGQVATQTGPSVTNPVTSAAHRLKVTYTYDANFELVAVEEDDIAGSDPTRTTTFQYDAHGRQTRMTDAESGQHDTSYDAVGNVTKECDPTDICTSYTYDGDNNVLSVTADGNTSVTTTYTYDDDGRVETITDGEGRTRLFRYDYVDRVIGEYLQDYDWGGTLDELNIVTTTYDELGQVTFQEYGGRPNGDFTAWTTNPTRVVRNVYDPAGLVDEVREYDDDFYSAGSPDRVTESDYNSWGAPIEVRVETSGGTVKAETRYSYFTSGANRGRLDTDTVENGTVDLVTSYTYNDRGLLTGVVSPRGNVTGATAADYTTTFAYDVLGRRTTTTAPSVTIDTGTSTSTGTPTTTVGYNTFGDQTHASDPRGETVTVDFDDLGRPETSTYPTYTPPGGSAITPTEQVVYDAAGRVVTSEDRYLQDTTYAYDDVGRLETVTAPTVTLDDNGTPGNTSDDTFATPVTTYTYDDTGAVLTVTSPNGATITNAYDEAGRLETKTQTVPAESVPLPGGGSHNTAAVTVVVENRYDDLGRLTETSVPYTSGGTPVFTTRTYDELGRIATVEDPDARTTTRTYDLLDRQLTTTDGLGRASENVFDLAGRRTKVRQLDVDGDIAAETVYSYDADSNLTAVNDPAGVTTAYAYDALGRLTEVTAPHDGTGTAVTSYGYDEAGNMTRSVDARGNTTVYAYQDWGLLEDLIEASTTAYPNAADRTYTTAYDKAGQPVTETQPGPVTITNVYDELGRLRTQTSGAVSRVFMYDVAGRVTALDHPDGPQEFFYDERNLLIASLGPAGDSTYGYDAAGRLTGRDDAAGTSTFTWTDAGLLDSLVDPQTGVTADWTYNTAGQATDIDYTPSGGGSTFGRSFGYDNAGRLVTDTHTDTSANVVAVNRMAYDPRGDLVWETQAPDPTTAGGTVTSLYGYDPADRLETWDSVQDPDITLVVANSSSPATEDDDLAERLETMFSATVTLRSDELTAPSSGADVVVISPSVSSSALDSGYESVDLPVVNLKSGSWDEMSLSTVGPSSATENDITIIDGTDPLAASLVGDEAISTGSSNLASVDDDNFGTGVNLVAFDDGTDNAAAFTYEQGSTLADSGAAPARRVGIGYTSSKIGDLTNSGWQLFDNAIAWALTDPTATNVDSVEYGYDKNSNRTSVTDASGTDTSTYDERNRLITGPEGDYTWTPRGTLTEIDDGSTTSLYAFDGLGRMTAANDGVAVTYTYDSLDRIAARNGSGSGFEFNGASINPTTDGNSIYTLTPSGSIFALDTPSSAAKVATLNRHGDLQRIADPTDGTTDAHNLTDPWGAPLTTAGDTPDAGYQGDYTDPDTGDIWMGARWYDPDSGTFPSRDTYGGTADNPKSGNRNLYGEANPNKHWDPTGRAAICIGWDGSPTTCGPTAPAPKPSQTCDSPASCSRLVNNTIPGGSDGFGTSNLQQGSSGAAVTNWQNALTQAGFSPGAADGQFGPNTHAATVAFQRSKGLSPDGIVGPNTKTAMKQALTSGITSVPPTPVPKETPGNLHVPPPVSLANAVASAKQPVVPAPVSLANAVASAKQPVVPAPVSLANAVASAKEPVVSAPVALSEFGGDSPEPQGGVGLMTVVGTLVETAPSSLATATRGSNAVGLTIVALDAVGVDVGCLLMCTMDLTTDMKVEVCQVDLECLEAAGVDLYHYTTLESALLIANSEIRTSGGRVYLTPDIYEQGLDAQLSLALNKTPDGFFAVEVSCLEDLYGPHEVNANEYGPGGGTEYWTTHDVPSACIGPFVVIG